MDKAASSHWTLALSLCCFFVLITVTLLFCFRF
uniref:Uncharacterized protein n=1 Tax=Rhizophora mucronata TaxID=61149 RepID=A0A2P2QE81_RHIMU